MMTLLRYVEETASTNEDVRKLMSEGAPHGSAIFAGTQRSGRGRLGRVWFSPEGLNLYLSVGLTAPRQPRELQLLPLAVGALCATVIEERTGARVGLKWPNDLWIGEKKVGGILCESLTSGSTLQGAIVGIGVNVNIAENDLPDDLAAIATSLRMETGRAHDIEALAGALRSAIVDAGAMVEGGQQRSLLDLWQQRDISRGRRVRLLEDQREGVAEGLEKDGALRVRFDDGTTRVVRSGEISFVRDTH